MSPWDIPDLGAVSLQVAVCVQSGPAPWWALLPGQCSEHRLRATFDPVVNTSSCADLWAGVVPTQVSATSTNFLGMVVVEAVAALPVEQPLHVPAGSAELYVFRLALVKARTTGPDACPGCSTPAAIAINRLELLTLSGSKIILTGDGSEGILRCNGGVFAYCLNVPAQNRTWGQIKSLYR